MKKITKMDMAKLAKFKIRARKNKFKGMRKLFEDMISKYNTIHKLTHFISILGVTDATYYNWCRKYDEMFEDDDTTEEYVRGLFQYNISNMRLKMFDNFIQPHAHAKLQLQAYKMLCKSQDTKESKEELDVIQNVAVEKAKNTTFTLLGPFDDNVEVNDSE